RLHAAGAIELLAEVLDMGVTRCAFWQRGARSLNGGNRPGMHVAHTLLRIPEPDGIANEQLNAVIVDGQRHVATPQPRQFLFTEANLGENRCRGIAQTSTLR